MITGHTILKRHLHIMKIEEDPTCEHCQEDDETVEHYICHCEAFAWARLQVFGTHFMKNEELKSLDLDELLQFIRTTKRFEM